MATSLSKDGTVFSTVCKAVQITVEKIDITQCDVDVIAVPINRKFSFSYGIARCVAAAAGPSFRNEVSLDLSKHKNKTFSSGTIKCFSGYNLKARRVMAIVSSSNPHDIGFLYESVIVAAEQEKAESLCLCGFGTGFLGVPSKLVAESAYEVLSKLLFSSKPALIALKRIRFVDLNGSLLEKFKKVMRQLNDSKGQPSNVPEPDSCDSGSENDLVEPDHFFDCFTVVNLSSSEFSSQTMCAICLDDFDDETNEERVVVLSKCKHVFHEGCIKQSFVCIQAQCPVCKQWYGIPHGNQPLGGKMKVSLHAGNIPGYPDAHGYFQIEYVIPGGIQTNDHLRPGEPFSGTCRYAFLPNNSEGHLVLELLRLAFHYRLIFTVGDSVTSGARNVVVWNNIHHKTKLHGGAFGYPDDTYLKRVKEELASVGITEELLSGYPATEK